MKRSRLILLLAWLVGITVIAPYPASGQEGSFHEGARIGRGRVQHVEWHPGGDLVLVDTVRGAWLYTARLEDFAHLEGLLGARFSPDGGLLAGGSGNDIALWQIDPATQGGEQVATLQGHHATVRELAWNRDGSQLASLDVAGRLIVWDRESRQQLWTVTAQSPALLSWSPANTFLAADSGPIWIWQASSGEVIAAPQDSPATDSTRPPQRDLRWQDDTTLLRYGDDAQFIDAWDATSGSQLGSNSSGYVPETTEPFTLRRYVTSGQSFVYVGSAQQAAQLRIETWFTTAQWNPQGRYLLIGGEFTGSETCTLHLVDVRAMRLERQYDCTQPGEIAELAWSPNGEHFLSLGIQGDLTMWDMLATQPQATRYDHGAITGDFAWSTNGRWLAAPDGFHNVLIWDAQRGTRLHTLSGHTDVVDEVHWQPGGSLLATSLNWDPLTLSPGQTVRIWDGENGTLLAQFNYQGSSIETAWRPNGTILAITEGSGQVHIWDAAARTITATLDVNTILQTSQFTLYSLHPAQIVDLAWSPGGQNLVAYLYGDSATFFNFAIDYDAQAALAVCCVQMPHNDQALAAAWTADDTTWYEASWRGRQYATVEDDYTITINANDDQAPAPEPLVLDQHQATVAHALWSPDGARLFSIDAAGVGILWDIAGGGEALFTVSGLPDTALWAWSPDGTMIASVGTRTILVYDATSGAMRAVLTLEAWNDFSPGRHGRLRWSADSRRLALWADGTIFIWQRD